MRAHISTSPSGGPVCLCALQGVVGILVDTGVPALSLSAAAIVGFVAIHSKDQEQHDKGEGPHAGKSMLGAGPSPPQPQPQPCWCARLLAAGCWFSLNCCLEVSSAVEMQQVVAVAMMYLSMQVRGWHSAVVGSVQRSLICLQ